MGQYLVIVSNKAHLDIAECVGFIKKVSKEAAIQLAEEIYSSLSTLDSFPERNPLFEAPKSFPFTLRKHIINTRYIALYTIENQKVVVYRVLDSRRKFGHLV